MLADLFAKLLVTVEQHWRGARYHCLLGNIVLALGLLKKESEVNVIKEGDKKSFGKMLDSIFTELDKQSNECSFRILLRNIAEDTAVILKGYYNFSDLIDNKLSMAMLAKPSDDKQDKYKKWEHIIKDDADVKRDDIAILDLWKNLRSGHNATIVLISHLLNKLFPYLSIAIRENFCAKADSASAAGKIINSKDLDLYLSEVSKYLNLYVGILPKIDIKSHYYYWKIFHQYYYWLQNLWKTYAFKDKSLPGFNAEKYDNPYARLRALCKAPLILEQLHTTEAITQLLNLVEQINTDLADDNYGICFNLEVIKQRLEEHRQVFAKNPDIQAQKDFNEFYCGIAQDFFNRSLQLLNPSPCEPALFLLGSSSCHNAVLFSDIEIAFSHGTFVPTAKREIQAFYTTLLHLFEFFVMSLGETSLGDSKAMQGLYIDVSTSHPLVDNGSRGTPSEIIRFKIAPGLVSKNHFKDFHLYQMLQPKLLNNKEGQALYNDYVEQVKKLLDQEVQNIEWEEIKLELGLKIVSNEASSSTSSSSEPIEKKNISTILLRRQVLALTCLYDVLKNSQVKKLELNLGENEWSIKDSYFKPLTYFALNLKLFYQLKSEHPYDILTDAESLLNTSALPGILGVIPKAFLALVKKAMVTILKIRVALHVKNNGRRVEIFDWRNIDSLAKWATLNLEIISEGIIKPLLMAMQDYLQYDGELAENKLHNILSAYFAQRKTWYDKAGLIPLVEVLADYSDINGWNPRLEETEKLWVRNLHSLVTCIPEIKPGAVRITVKSQFFNKNLEYGLSQEFVAELLKNPRSTIVGREDVKKEPGAWMNPDGSFNFDLKKNDQSTMHGNHLVIPVDWNGIKVHLKVYPEFPARETAINLLYRLLFPDNLVPHVDLWLWQCGAKNTYPILVSETMPGDTLSDVLKTDPNALSKVNARNYALHCIMSMIIDYEDAKPANIIANKINNELFLSFIDNDRVLSLPFIGTVLQIKNILYVCEQFFHTTVPAEIVEHFALLNIGKVLDYWLDLVKQQNEGYFAIFKNHLESFYKSKKTFSDTPIEKSLVLIFFAKTTIKELYDRMEIIKDELSKNPLLFIDLLGRIHGRLANHYWQSYKLGKTPEEQLAIAAGNAYDQSNPNKRFITKTDMNKQVKDMRGAPIQDIAKCWQEDFVATKKQLAQINDSTQKILQIRAALLAGNANDFIKELISDKSREDVINGIDFHLITTPDRQPDLMRQKIILQAIIDTGYYSDLNLSGCMALDNTTLESILIKSPNLNYLILDGCQALKDNIVTIIADNCPYLKRLSLNGLNVITGIEISHTFTASTEVYFPSLKYLSLQSCENLISFYIKAPHLESLSLRNAPKLSWENTQIFTDGLLAIDLMDCVNFFPQDNFADFLLAHLVSLQAHFSRSQLVSFLVERYKSISTDKVPSLLSYLSMVCGSNALLTKIFITFLVGKMSNDETGRSMVMNALNLLTPIYGNRLAEQLLQFLNQVDLEKEPEPHILNALMFLAAWVERRPYLISKVAVLVMDLFKTNKKILRLVAGIIQINHPQVTAGLLKILATIKAKTNNAIAAAITDSFANYAELANLELPTIAALSNEQALQREILEELYMVSAKGIQRLLNEIDAIEDRVAIVSKLDFKEINNIAYQQAILSTLAVCEKVTQLTLLNCAALNDVLLQQITGYFPALTKLEISGCTNISGKGIRAASQLPKLQELQATNIQRIRTFRLTAVMPELSVVNLSNCAQLQTVVFQAPKLTALNLTKCLQLQEKLFDAKIPTNCQIILDGCELFTPGTRILRTLFPNREVFANTVAQYSMGQIIGLNFTDLKILNDEQLQAILQDLPKLRHLNLNGNTELTNNVIDIIAKFCPDIEELYLNGLEIDKIDYKETNVSSSSSNSPQFFKTSEQRAFNKLRILSLENCLKLRGLSLCALQLKILRIKGSKNLESFYIETNQSEITDLSSCEKLPETERLLKRYLHLASIPIAQLHQLSDSFWENLRQLVDKSTKNTWSPPDLSKCSSLEKEYWQEICKCEGVFLRQTQEKTKKEEQQDWERIKAKFPNYDLTSNSLDLSRKQIGAAGAKSLAEALMHPHCKLTELGLDRNQIGAKGAKSLAEALMHPNCKLTELRLNDNQIGDAGVQSLANALKHLNCKLTSLDLYDNQIGDAGAQSLAEALMHPNCKLTLLYLSWNQIGAAGAKSLAEALMHPNCKLTSLNLAGNEIGAEGAQSLAKALMDPNCKLTSLNLWSNQIGDAGAQNLAEALKDPNCKLTSLDLSSNQIGDTGAQSLAEALMHPNCKLTLLYLSWNQIGAAGAKSLAEALMHPNCKLMSLDLCGNQFGAEGAQSLAKALMDPNCKLTSLNLWSNQIGDAGAQSLAEALIHPNSKLTKLDLRYNQIGDTGAQSLADALMHPNCKLMSLDLCGNQFGTAGVQSLANALKHPNCKLMLLMLGGNQIEDAGAKSLALAVATTELNGRDVNITGIDDFYKLVEDAKKSLQLNQGPKFRI